MQFQNLRLLVPTRSCMTVTFFAKKFAKFYFTAKLLQPCRFEHRTHLFCKFEHENPKKVCPGTNGLIHLFDLIKYELWFNVLLYSGPEAETLHTGTGQKFRLLADPAPAPASQHCPLSPNTRNDKSSNRLFCAYSPSTLNKTRRIRWMKLCSFAEYAKWNCVITVRQSWALAFFYASRLRFRALFGP